MRLGAPTLILLGILMLAMAVHDQHRGTGTATGPGPGETETAERRNQPDEFERVIVFEYVRGFLVLSGGVFLWSWGRRSERLDPFSARFAGKLSIDEMERSLDEKVRQQSPPR